MSVNEALRRIGPLWTELRHVMRGHVAPGHDEVDTFNRLLVKRRERFEPTLMLQIPAESLRIAAENWNLEELWGLLHPSQIVDDDPGLPEGAVVVLRWDSRDFLMDGRRRINYWKRKGIKGPHRVLVVDKAPSDI